MKCDPLIVSFKLDEIKGTAITDLSARWLPVVDTVLPLLTAIIEPETFFRKLSSEESFLENTKKHLDAMIVATSNSDKWAGFKTIVTPA